MTDVQQNLIEIHERIAQAAQQAGKTHDDITLVNVSKTFDADRVMLAYDAGERIFGENRVQEYLEKREKMPEDVKWHIIGRLQTNKVKYIIDDIYLLHSLDRMHLAQALSKELTKKQKTLDVLLQVNTGCEYTKAGFEPGELKKAAEEISKFDNIKVKGLMTVAPFTDDLDLLKRVFDETKALYDDISSEKFDNADMKWLSMGMSGDFELAIRHGANMIRVGSSIFGKRIYK